MEKIDWLRFDRRNITHELEVRVGGRLVTQKVARFGCASADQALLYLLRRDALGPEGRLDRSVAGIEITVKVPGLVAGQASVCVWDTVKGSVIQEGTHRLDARGFLLLPALAGDYAVAVQWA